MEWYTILFIIVMSLFVIKLIISIFGGDFDMDVDFDGNTDFDSSSAFSFKGLLHFLVGFSSYLFAKDNIYNINGFSFLDYIIAIICGICFMVILFYGYKLAMKANNSSKNPEDLINNSKGIIYINLGNGQYSVQAHTLSGTINVTAFYSGDNLEPGTEVTLSKEGNNILINTING